MPYLRNRQPVPEETLSQLIHGCLLELLAKNPESTEGICPSSVAQLAAEDLNIDWRDLMRSVRLVAATLADQGRLDILQDGVPGNIHEVRGNIRLRLRKWRSL